MSRRLAVTVLAAAWIAAPGRAGAGGFAVVEQSAVAGGTAGAGTARAGDPGAAFYNPAALADGAGLRLGAGLLVAAPELRAEGQDGSFESRSERRLSTPPQLHASYARGRLAGGLYAGVPYGGGVAWPEGWPGRHEILASRLEVLRVAPFFGASFGRLRAAGGVHVDFGRLRVERTLDFVDAEGDVRLDLAGRGVGVHLALHYAAADDLDLGLAYKSRTRLRLGGGAAFTAPDAFAARIPDQRARTEMTMPDRIAAGAAWRRGRLTVLGDVDLTLWSVNRELVIDFEMEQTPDAVQVNRWRSTTSLRGGAEYRADAGVTVRAGALYDPSPVPSERLSPSSPDAHRVGVSAGFGKELGAIGIDVFYELLHLLARDAAAGDEALSARYRGRAHLLGIGVRTLM